jgi:hypothetical protein
MVGLRIHRYPCLYEVNVRDWLLELADSLELRAALDHAFTPGGALEDKIGCAGGSLETLGGPQS